MVKLCLEPYDYHLPIIDFNRKPLLITSSAMEFGVKLSRKIKKGQWFWNRTVCSYSDTIGKMPKSYFTGFMAEPSTLEHVDEFNGRQDLLSTLWNLHCGFISQSTVKNMAIRQPVPQFVTEGSKVSVMVPTRDFTYINIPLSKFMLRYGEFAEYFCSRMDSYVIEKESAKDE